MRHALIVASLAGTIGVAWAEPPWRTEQEGPVATARESRVPAGNGSLYTREIGRGTPFVVLHGGPDFDHRYFLPDLDRLATGYRLIYYDQRGRGLSADRVRPEDVTIASEVADLDTVRQHFQLEPMVLFGHSWGTVLALEYALQHPARVSHLILLNPAPASTADVAVLRKSYLAQLGPAMERQREILSSAAYQAGDPETVAARYRIHFTHALARPDDYEKLMTVMRSAFLDQGPDGILKARAVEDHLMAETWQVASYDLLPRVRTLRIPTLVIGGDHDFIPLDIATHINDALPDSRLNVLKNCGHFAYLECPADTRAAIDAFLKRAR